ncbi:MAG: mannonate dehydratase [Pseudomonadales bacterium]|jgi:mannonate dehydratase|nr:mannonate dehydratase [Pseudomonadales bacterium]
MQETWRWFGPDDTVTPQQIRQAGASGVVTALDHIKTGEIWSLEEIKTRQSLLTQNGVEWTVAESVPVHQDIKLREGNYQAYIDNYRQSLVNLGKQGIKRVCYNFMPVVDWTRTNLSFELENGSSALRFEMSDFVAYDIHILERPNAASDYSEAQVGKAAERFSGMDDEDKILLESNIIAGLPGGEGSYDRQGIREAIEAFQGIGTAGLRRNLLSFLTDIIPTAETAGVVLAIHPDDPPFSLFGLPRVVSTAQDARAIIESIPSTSNGLTMCAGSYGARSDNDLVAMVNEFGRSIHFVHLRNIHRETDGSFYETQHLEGDNDIVGIIRALLNEESARRHNNSPLSEIPMRPDHGHAIGDEKNDPAVRPGYSFAGRLKGLAELRGVIHALTTLAQ